MKDNGKINSKVGRHNIFCRRNTKQFRTHFWESLNELRTLKAKNLKYSKILEAYSIKKFTKI